jgi:UDP-N-acetylmuramate dehydrogenase
MMAARATSPNLTDRLPRVRGSYESLADVGRMTWFRVGGPAEVLFTPADVADLATFLKHKPTEVPVFVLGLGSNLLVRDGGVPGVVVKLGKAFNTIDVDGLTLRCGAAAVDANVAIAARDAGISGLEFLTGIPGTIGGALRMNAGCYGREIKDICVNATALDALGNVHKLLLNDLGFTYRHCSIPDDWIFVGAELQGWPGDAAAITQRLREIRAEREDSQPTQARTGGSTFANPPGAKAWKLIDDVGGRGLTMGGAMVSEKHTNFLINTGTATSADIESLGEELCRRVKDKAGIELTWEIRRIGVTTSDAHALSNGGAQ